MLGATECYAWHLVHGDRPMFSEIVRTAVHLAVDDLTIGRLRGERKASHPNMDRLAVGVYFEGGMATSALPARPRAKPFIAAMYFQELNAKPQPP